MTKKYSPAEIANLIEQCAKDQLAVNDIANELVALDYADVSESINLAIHCLSHFATDSDIRENDSVYDQYQREQLIEYAKKIRDL